MKKTLALLLACLFLLTASFAAGDGVPAEGFDPAAVAAGMQAKINAQITEPLVLVPADTPNLYTVFSQGADLGCCYLNFDHTDKEGKSGAEGVKNHLAFTVVFAYDQSTAQSYLTLWLLCSGGLMQYLTGAGEMGAVTDKLYASLSAATASPGHEDRWTEGAYDCRVSVMSGSGMLLIGTEVTVRDLY